MSRNKLGDSKPERSSGLSYAKKYGLDLEMAAVRRLRPKCEPRKIIKKRLPIVEWLPNYKLEYAICDFIAGITVGLTAIPQGIAYAIVAKLQPQYGLYSAFMGCFIYCLFGSSKDITVGPTAIMSLLTSEYTHNLPDYVRNEYVILLTFLSGIIILSLGILKLGFVIDFISVPVTAGFTSAAAITIASGQVAGIFGLEMKERSHVEGLAGVWIDIFDNFNTMRVPDTVLGITCIVVLLLMRSMKDLSWYKAPEESKQATWCQQFWRRFMNDSALRCSDKFIWLLSTGRNAVVVVLCALVASAFDPVLSDKPSRNTTFILTGNIEAGLPHFGAPPFSLNTTEGGFVDFQGMIKELGSAVIIIPLLCILENVAIAKAFAGGKAIDASQEMIAVGMCNIFGSFSRSMPTTGSFSRTAVNAASGVKTPLGGIFTGALVLLSLGLMMPYCAYIPKASLAAVIITAVIFSVEYEVLRPMWRSKKIDLVPAFATFFCCLFWALEFGILVGVAIQILFALYNMARPSIHIETRELSGFSYLWISPDRALIFPSISYVRSVINKASTGTAHSKWPIVLDCSRIASADFTAAEGFKSLISDFGKRQQPLVFFNISTSVVNTLQGVHLQQKLIVANSEFELHQQLLALFEKASAEILDSAVAEGSPEDFTSSTAELNIH